ncbi:hypothetical protein [Burkholderia ubonensis]|uniref:hypothetical protein n=1 Tax=Burkholderia ubonensis TaxID=101571 RepID=UPI00075E071B|nr:hypothetical protein [Burkholderia ubonensis]KVP17051.1 hypothetical protein WJ84_01895 [Burkholderia ubonensis]
MKVLIVAEKPAVSRCIAPVARRHWPDASITFVHAVPYGNIRFSYPRGLKFDQYPLLSEPRDKLAPWDEWVCAPVRLSADGELAPGAMSHELFTSADVIVCACDPDHTGAVGFEVLMRQVFGDARALDCPTLVLHSLDTASIDKAFTNLQPVREAFAHSLEYGRTKRYFDWNWNVNSRTTRSAAPARRPMRRRCQSMRCSFCMACATRCR